MVITKWTVRRQSGQRSCLTDLTQDCQLWSRTVYFGPESLELTSKPRTELSGRPTSPSPFTDEKSWAAMRHKTEVIKWTSSNSSKSFEGSLYVVPNGVKSASFLRFIFLIVFGYVRVRWGYNMGGVTVGWGWSWGENWVARFDMECENKSLPWWVMTNCKIWRFRIRSDKLDWSVLIRRRTENDLFKYFTNCGISDGRSGESE